ncbi:alpha/beta hydrolase family protein [Urechidicola croceus]|uniref:Alpha/beta hydrolase n=1 Tax=Urechidicola croceus TaxID=1850246 RepID=A0A1D8P601_9FLAO|nr:alpha/beta hydrolase [Urechidicola croceus]AOW19989.1 alpha/beta hydrolase [Urechidicola croceus]
MSKTHIYCVPGLAANGKIFEHIKLPKEKYKLHLIKWLIPKSIDESIEHYAQRMTESITEDNFVLMGVSFGGIMVQEMSKIVQPKKVIIISSVKSRKELPRRLKLTKLIKAYKLFPANSITTIENFMSYSFGKMTKKRIEQYQMYLSVRNPIYLNWAIYNVLHWKQDDVLQNIYHIHGTEDNVFPFKHIKNCISIKGGSHIMIINKAKKISKIINGILEE